MRVVSLGVVSLIVSNALAHEFWIEPSRFEPAPGEIARVRLMVGEHLAGDAVPRNDARIDRFVSIQSGVASLVPGADGADPAGSLRLDDPGTAIVAYAGRPSFIELEAAKFEAYLEAEGLDGARAERARTRSTTRAGRERYSRCAKSILVPGPEATVSVGLALEIVPERDTGTLRPGETLAVRLLHRGQPLAGALVKALDRAEGASPVLARTDAAGRATLTLPRAGFWLLNAVHMVPVRDDPRVDWESTWASLTFELPERK